MHSETAINIYAFRKSIQYFFLNYNQFCDYKLCDNKNRISSAIKNFIQAKKFDGRLNSQKMIV